MPRISGTSKKNPGKTQLPTLIWHWPRNQPLARLLTGPPEAGLEATKIGLAFPRRCHEDGETSRELVLGSAVHWPPEDEPFQ